MVTKIKPGSSTASSGVPGSTITEAPQLQTPMMVMFVRHILGGWGSALETNNTLIHTNLSQAHKTFSIIGSDVAQDIIPFSACEQNLLTQDNGSCTISEETYLCGKSL